MSYVRCRSERAAGHGAGLVQAFRRAENDAPTRVLRLSGLEPAAHYEVKDLDTGATRWLCGEALMQQGLCVEIREQPGSLLIVYAKGLCP